MISDSIQRECPDRHSWMIFSASEAIRDTHSATEMISTKKLPDMEQPYTHSSSA
jgi:hypothetical protein